MISWITTALAELWFAAFLAAGVIVFLVALFLKPILDVSAPLLAASPIVGPLRAVGKVLGVLAALYGGWNLAMVQHDAALAETWQAAQTKAVNDALEIERKDGEQRVMEAEQKAREGALADAPTREVIRRVPVQTACASSPAIRAALDAMRPASSGAGSRAAAPRVP